MRIIDDTYNGKKYPIIEREYNAYYFPDNYDPDNLVQQADGIAKCIEDRCTIQVYNRANPR